METEHDLERRKFIGSILKAAGALTLMQSSALAHAASWGDQGALTENHSARSYTVQEVIDLIFKQIPGSPFPNTVDTLKSGKPAMQVRGIVTTMFSNIDLIEEAIKLNANFIIAHEPTYYNHLDDLNFVPNNTIARQKLDFLTKHEITVWRFHDSWHRYMPDGIKHGVLQALGWLPYFQPENGIGRIPAVPVSELIRHLKERLNIKHLRLVGDPSQTCQTVALMVGAAGGQRQISMIETEKPDVLIVGEASEWETPEYVRDARKFGSKTNLIVLGHSLSEEPGMEWLAEWLRPQLGGMQITHIPTKEPFTWL